MGSVYLGAGGVAKKVKSMYIGVDGVAKKVKKAWIGVGGVAKLFYSSEPSLTYYKQTTLTSAGSARATYNSNYAMVYYADYKADFFNPSLTKTNKSFSSSITGSSMAMGSNANYHMMAGGAKFSSTGIGNPIATINVFNSNLTYSTTSLNTAVRNAHTATVNNNYVFWIGGVTNGYSAVVQATNNNLTTTTCTSTSGKKYETVVGSVGNYVLILGARPDSSISYTTVVEVYNSSLTKCSNATSMPSVILMNKTASNSAYLIAAGGYLQSSKSPTNTAVAYNTNLTQSTTSLSYAPKNHSGISTEEIAIFAGGYINDNASSAVKTINYFNTSLVRTSPSTSGSNRWNFGGAVIGNYIILAGGCDGSSYYDSDLESTVYSSMNKVDIYTM